MFDKDDKKKDNQKAGLFSFMNDESDKDKDYNDDNDELTEWQKEEIKKGNYDPWDFEEDDVDDDSYYSEDDD
jgi:hypothetical protein